MALVCPDTTCGLQELLMLCLSFPRKTSGPSVWWPERQTVSHPPASCESLFCKSVLMSMKWELCPTSTPGLLAG